LCFYTLGHASHIKYIYDCSLNLNLQGAVVVVSVW
jgi:hypothetical protein